MGCVYKGGYKCYIEKKEGKATIYIYWIYVLYSREKGGQVEAQVTEGSSTQRNLLTFLYDLFYDLQGHWAWQPRYEMRFIFV